MAIISGYADRGLRRLLVHIIIGASFIWVTCVGKATACNLMEVLQQQPAFSRFVVLLDAGGLGMKLKESGDFTVFAPSNAAFDSLPPQLRHTLLEKPEAALAKRTVESLIVPSIWMPEDLAQKRMFLKALNGRMILVDGTRGELTAGDSEILSIDVTPCHGVIYEIDSVDLSY